MSERELDPEVMRLAAQIRRTDRAFKRIGRFDTWVHTVDITGWLDGDFKDWPAHIQDPILKAIERDCIPKPGERAELVVARCYKDVPDEPAYIRIVVQAFPVVEH